MGASDLDSDREIRSRRLVSDLKRAKGETLSICNCMKDKIQAKCFELNKTNRRLEQKL